MVDRIGPPPRRDPVRSRLRHRRLPDLRVAPHAQALREAARGRAKDAGRPSRGGEEAAPAHALRHQHAAARHRRSELRPPRQHPRSPLYRLGGEGPGRYRAHQSAVRRKGGGRHRKQFSAAFPHAGDGGPVPGPHHPAVEAAGAGSRGVAGRLVVRGRGQDSVEGAPDGGVQPSHRCSSAEFRVSALRLCRDQSAVLREGGNRLGISGSTSTWCRRGRRLIP